MTTRFLLFFAFFSCFSYSFSQNQLEIVVLDSLTKEPLFGSKAKIKGTNTGAITNEEGKATLLNISNGTHTLLVSSATYHEKNLILDFPLAYPSPLVIYLSTEVEEMEEIIVEATRANKSIGNLPTRTEVLTEEIDEAASMEPSKIGHLLTHSTGIQVQTTSATSNGAVVRIQGLNGRYTQLLKDGFPLYGGFSGSLDIMQIPPLDLRQVEYIKGSASTLYGAGAIGGLVNLLSKKADKEETLLHLNVSHIGAKDFNAFVSRKLGKFGFTNLASMHLHSPYDADKDGFSDLPEVSKFNFNPKIFYQPNEKTEMYVGANVTIASLTGGDMKLIQKQATDSTNFYLDDQKSSRFTSQFSINRELSKASSLKLKNSISSFSRYINIRENALGDKAEFAGNQLNSFSELNYNLNKTRHNLNIGLNYYTNQFTEEKLDTLTLRNQESTTYGLYVNHLWDITEKLALESGLRADYVQAKSLISENSSEPFVLPRVSVLYKLTRKFSLRASGGMGYRMPTIFSEEAEPYGYKNIRTIDFSALEAERSTGGNFDFKYISNLGSKNLLLTLNQMFFYNSISNPILLNTGSAGELFFSNGADFLISQGFESQIKLTVYQFTWFFGYTYTDAFLQNGTNETNLILTPQHSIKGDLLFQVPNKWRIGWDYEYKSEQLLSSGLYSRSLFTTGVLVERTLDQFVIFLNAENFTDTRQTRYGSIASGPNNTPQFTDIYAPLDGFFFNVGLKIKL